MKRIIIAAVAVVFASSLALAQNPGRAPKGPGPDKPKMQEVRKDMEKSRKELSDLGERYRKETDAAKKAAIKTQIEAKAGNIYDENLTNMKKRSAQARERLADMDKKLDEAQKPEVKAKHVQDMTQKVIEGKSGRSKAKGGSAKKEIKK